MNPSIQPHVNDMARDLKTAYSLLYEDVLTLFKEAIDKDSPLELFLAKLDELPVVEEPIQKAKANKPSAYEKARLKGKYQNWSGENYNKLISAIIQENQVKTAYAVGSVDKKKFEVSTKGKIEMPSLSYVINRSPTIIKSADQGQLLNKTLREKLRTTIKATIQEEGLLWGGKTKQKTVNAVKSAISGVFENYTSKGIPANIETIAVTETMAISNAIKEEYARETKRTTGLNIKKRWLHFPSKSDEPRKGHAQLNRKSIDSEDFFVLKGYKSGKPTGEIFKCQRPYDPTLPGSERIGCHCELEYYVEKT